MKIVFVGMLMLICSDLRAQCNGQTKLAVVPQAGATVSFNASASKFATEMAQLASRESLTKFMKMTPADRNPLMLLSKDARERFLESLTFNHHGLTGYRYIDLENELTPTQIARLLALFGSQGNTSLFRKAQVKTAKDRRILNDEPGPMLEDCSSADEGGDYPSGGGVTTNPPRPPAPPPPPLPPPPTAPRDYVGYECYNGSCHPDREYICKHTCRMQ